MKIVKMAAKERILSAERKYPDLRYKYMRSLIDYERWQRKKHYQKSAAEWTSRAIVSLELTEKHIKTAKQASQLEGIGAEIKSRLQIIERDVTYDIKAPPGGRFTSSAGALMVAMLLCTEEIKKDGNLNTGKVLVPEKMLMNYAQDLSEEVFVRPKAEAESVLCPAWWRLNVLATRNLVKKRSQKKEPVYELLPEGYLIGQKLAKRVGLKLQNEESVQKAQQTLQGQMKKESLETEEKLTSQDQALYTNDDGTDGLILLVDIQEWGGDRVGLGELCRILDQSALRYRTKKLPVGDYVWVWRCGDILVHLPLVIERKRIDDLARSLLDGRYMRQKQKMLELKNKFLAVDTDMSLKYLVEGDAKDYMVKCQDGCGAILKCGWPTVSQLKNKLEEIDRSPDFDLIQTVDIRATVNLLATMAAELQKRLENGEFYDLLGKDLDINLIACSTKRPSNATRARENCTKKRTWHNNNTKKGERTVDITQDSEILQPPIAKVRKTQTQHDKPNLKLGQPMHNRNLHQRVSHECNDKSHSEHAVHSTSEDNTIAGHRRSLREEVIASCAAYKRHHLAVPLGQYHSSAAMPCHMTGQTSYKPRCKQALGRGELPIIMAVNGSDSEDEEDWGTDSTPNERHSDVRSYRDKSRRALSHTYVPHTEKRCEYPKVDFSMSERCHKTRSVNGQSRWQEPGITPTEAKGKNYGTNIPRQTYPDQNNQPSPGTSYKGWSLSSEKPSSSFVGDTSLYPVQKREETAGGLQHDISKHKIKIEKNGEFLKKASKKANDLIKDEPRSFVRTSHTETNQSTPKRNIFASLDDSCSEELSEIDIIYDEEDKLINSTSSKYTPKVKLRFSPKSSYSIKVCNNVEESDKIKKPLQTETVSMKDEDMINESDNSKAGPVNFTDHQDIEPDWELPNLYKIARSRRTKPAAPLSPHQTPPISMISKKSSHKINLACGVRDKVAMVLAVLPHVSPEVIEVKLKEHDENVDLVVGALLDS